DEDFALVAAADPDDPRTAARACRSRQDRRDHREDRARLLGREAVDLLAAEGAGERTAETHREHRARSLAVEHGGDRERGVARQKLAQSLRHRRERALGRRLHEDVDQTVATEAEAPDHVLVAARAVVAEAGHPGFEHGPRDLAHVRFEAAAADAAERRPRVLDQELGPRPAVGGARDAHHGREGRPPPSPLELGDPGEDLRRFLPVVHAAPRIEPASKIPPARGGIQGRADRCATLDTPERPPRRRRGGRRRYRPEASFPPQGTHRAVAGGKSVRRDPEQRSGRLPRELPSGVPRRDRSPGRGPHASARGRSPLSPDIPKARSTAKKAREGTKKTRTGTLARPRSKPGSESSSARTENS